MIEAVHLCKRYGAQTAVEDIHFSVSPGEIVGLIGHNGSGKTTTMRMLTGCLEPTSGDVLIDGQSLLRHAELKKQIGYLPEIPPLYPEMTVNEQMCFAAGLLKERALLLLLPLYPIGYVCTRLSRRTGLGRSLALTLPLSLLGALGVAVLGWWMAGRGTPLEALRSFRFYEALWPALCGNVRAAVTLPGRFSPSELALGALAVLTLPELLHGLCRGRDLRCAMILLLLVSAAALWALSGLFLLPLPLAMALAWVWQRLCDRGAAVSAAVPAAVLALCAVSSILFMF